MQHKQNDATRATSSMLHVLHDVAWRTLTPLVRSAWEDLNRSRRKRDHIVTKCPPIQERLAPDQGLPPFIPITRNYMGTKQSTPNGLLMEDTKQKGSLKEPKINHNHRKSG
jgi:hypothetical protein